VDAGDDARLDALLDLAELPQVVADLVMSVTYRVRR